jgi:hypothetical protein
MLNSPCVLQMEISLLEMKITLVAEAVAFFFLMGLERLQPAEPFAALTALWMRGLVLIACFFRKGTIAYAAVILGAQYVGCARRDRRHAYDVNL